jgi:hypothetical protein
MVILRNFDCTGVLHHECPDHLSMTGEEKILGKEDTILFC